MPDNIYIGQRLSNSKVLSGNTHRKHTHTRIDFCTWTTKVVATEQLKRNSQQ